jgi:hypothetical protein
VRQLCPEAAEQSISAEHVVAAPLERAVVDRFGDRGVLVATMGGRLVVLASDPATLGSAGPTFRMS